MNFSYPKHTLKYSLATWEDPAKNCNGNASFIITLYAPGLNEAKVEHFKPIENV